MTRLQPTTRRPLSVPLAMSTAQDSTDNEHEDGSPSMATEPRVTRSPVHLQQETSHVISLQSEPHHSKPKAAQPRLMFEVRNLSHPGAEIFLEKVGPLNVLSDAVTSVMKILYKQDLDLPPVRSITLILKGMEGVAFTRGKFFDDAHKEIHFSLDYISRITPSTRQRNEIYGVIVHEMVHVWQHTCDNVPGGLIEGIADFVRLRAGYVSPRWKIEAGEKWDEGYQRTGYFLAWLDEVYGEGKVREINLLLKVMRQNGEKYDENKFWMKILGDYVQHAWEKYRKFLEDRNGTVKEEERT